MMTDTNRVLTELELSEGVARQLQAYGETFLVYLTAEFEPYSAQQKPDLVFVPALGPRTGEHFFVEVRLLRSSYLESFKATLLPEHKAFTLDSIGGTASHFAFATDASIDALTRSFLDTHGIYTISNISSASELTNNILVWAGIKPTDH